MTWIKEKQKEEEEEGDAEVKTEKSNKQNIVRILFC